MERTIAVNHTSYYTENEKHKIQDLSTSNLTIRDQGIGDDIENSYGSGSFDETDTLKADIRRLDCTRGGYGAFCKIVDRDVKFDHRGDAGAIKTDEVKMKLADVTKKCGRESTIVGDNAKKRSSCRKRSDAIKIDCRLFAIKISNFVAELVTTMDGCLCQYICKKANIQSMTVSFTYGKSKDRKLFIYGNEKGVRYAMKLLKRIIMSKNARACCEKNTFFVRPNQVTNATEYVPR